MRTLRRRRHSSRELADFPQLRAFVRSLVHGDCGAEDGFAGKPARHQKQYPRNPRNPRDFHNRQPHVPARLHKIRATRGYGIDTQGNRGCGKNSRGLPRALERKIRRHIPRGIRTYGSVASSRRQPARPQFRLVFDGLAQRLYRQAFPGNGGENSRPRHARAARVRRTRFACPARRERLRRVSRQPRRHECNVARRLARNGRPFEARRGRISFHRRSRFALFKNRRRDGSARDSRSGVECAVRLCGRSSSRTCSFLEARRGQGRGARVAFVG